MKEDEPINTENILNRQSFDLEIQSATDSAKTHEKKKLISNRESTLAGSEDYASVQERYFGKNCVFLFWKDNPLITIGPHWPLFLCMFSFILASGILLGNYIALHRSTFVYYLTYANCFVTLFFYLLTALKNPGILSRPHNLSEKELTRLSYCPVCKIPRETFTYHCQECEICVKGYDHHCPWTGKCIAEGNIVLFNCFVSTLFIYIIYCILLGLNVF